MWALDGHLTKLDEQRGHTSHVPQLPVASGLGNLTLSASSDLVADTFCGNRASWLSNSSSSNSNNRSSNGDGRRSNGNCGNCGRGDNVTSDADMGFGIGISLSLHEVKAAGCSNLVFWDSDDGHIYEFKCCNGKYVDDFHDDHIMMVWWWWWLWWWWFWVWTRWCWESLCLCCIIPYQRGQII